MNNFASNFSAEYDFSHHHEFYICKKELASIDEGMKKFWSKKPSHVSGKRIQNASSTVSQCRNSKYRSENTLMCKARNSIIYLGRQYDIYCFSTYIKGKMRIIGFV